MALSLDLEPDLEDRLREFAQERGLSAEGYLLTLIEALVEPPPAPKRPHLQRVWHKILRRPTQTPDAKATADTALRQRMSELLQHKEHTIAAVTKANLLQRTAEKLQAVIVEKELQTLTLARNGEDEQALRQFQESCVYGQNLQFTKSQFDTAAGEAEQLLLAYKLAEQTVQARLSSTQAAALEALDSEFTRTCLTYEQMERRIFAIGSEEEWQERFATWVDRIATPLPCAAPLNATDDN